jgi:hypothetical protein
LLDARRKGETDMNKIARKKFQLNREVLRTLTPQETHGVAGGAGRPSDNPAACRISSADPLVCVQAPRPSKDPIACRVSSNDPTAC